MSDVRIDPLLLKVNRFQEVKYQIPLTPEEVPWHVSAKRYLRSWKHREYTALCGFTFTGEARISNASTPAKGVHCPECARKLQELRVQARKDLQARIEREESEMREDQKPAMRPISLEQWLRGVAGSTPEDALVSLQRQLAKVEMYVKDSPGSPRTGMRMAKEAEAALHHLALWIIANHDLSHPQMQQVAQLALSSSYYFPGR